MAPHGLPRNWTMQMQDNWLMAGRNRRVSYVLLFLLAILVNLACLTGIIGSDDLGYSYFSQLISAGTYVQNQSHFGPRVGVTVPVGIIYRIFGIGEFTTILAPLVASAASVPLLVAIGHRLFTARAALLTGMLLLTFPVRIRYATVLLPEPIMEFWILVAVLVYLGALADDRATRAFLVGVCFGLAYLTKEIALFAGAAFILDSLLIRRWKLAVAAVGGLIAVGLVEVIYYTAATGDPLYRAHVIGSSQTAYLSAHMADPMSTWRLFKEYPYTMLLPNVHFGLHSVLTLLLVGAGMYWLPKRAVWMAMLWATVPMLYLNFGSASLAGYVPIAAAPRYIGLVYAPLFLLGGAALDRLIPKAQPVRSLCYGVVAVVTLSGLAAAYSTRAQGYSTAEVASLRAIQRDEQQTGQAVVAFEGPYAKRWQFAMELLAGSTEKVARGSGDCLVVRPDALGLPYTANAPGGCRQCPGGGAGRSGLAYPMPRTW